MMRTGFLPPASIGRAQCSTTCPMQFSRFGAHSLVRAALITRRSIAGESNVVPKCACCVFPARDYQGRHYYATQETAVQRSGIVFRPEDIPKSSVSVSGMVVTHTLCTLCLGALNCRFLSLGTSRVSGATVGQITLFLAPFVPNHGPSVLQWSNISAVALVSIRVSDT